MLKKILLYFAIVIGTTLSLSFAKTLSNGNATSDSFYAILHINSMSYSGSDPEWGYNLTKASDDTDPIIYPPTTAINRIGLDSNTIFLLCTDDGNTTNCYNTDTEQYAENKTIPITLNSNTTAEYSKSGKYIVANVHVYYPDIPTSPATIDFTNMQIKKPNGGPTNCGGNNYSLSLTEDSNTANEFGSANQKYIVKSATNGGDGCDEFIPGDGTAVISFSKVGEATPFLSTLAVNNNNNGNGACLLTLSMDATNNPNCQITLGDQSSVTININQSKSFPIQYSQEDCGTSDLELKFDSQNGFAVLKKNGNVWYVANQSTNSSCMRLVNSYISNGNTLNVHNK